VTDNVYCLVKIIEKDERIIAAVQFKIKLFDFFSTSLNSSLIIFIRTYTVNYRNALDRLRVCMNIILFSDAFSAGVHFAAVFQTHFIGFQASRLCADKLQNNYNNNDNKINKKQ